jgi:hypothetical protein
MTLYKEVNRTEPSTLTGIPWFYNNETAYLFKRISDKFHFLKS